MGTRSLVDFRVVPLGTPRSWENGRCLGAEADLLGERRRAMPERAGTAGLPGPPVRVGLSPTLLPLLTRLVLEGRAFL